MYRSVLFSLTVFIAAVLAYGFDRPETKVSTCDMSQFSWDQTIPLINPEDPSFNSKHVKFLVHPFHGHGLDRMDMLINSENQLEDYPKRWMDDVSQQNNASWIRIYPRAVSLSEIEKAESVVDLIEDYPAPWLQLFDYQYVSVSLQSKKKNRLETMISKSYLLSDEQKELLSKLENSDAFDIVINYEKLNFLTGEFDYDRMNVSLTILPEKPAEFPGGTERLNDYMQSKIDWKNESVMADHMFMGTVSFSVDQKGDPQDIVIKRESGDNDFDKKIMDLVKEMPRWTPALNKEGHAVTQRFELVYGIPMQGC